MPETLIGMVVRPGERSSQSRGYLTYADVVNAVAGLVFGGEELSVPEWP